MGVISGVTGRACHEKHHHSLKQGVQHNQYMLEASEVRKS